MTDSLLAETDAVEEHNYMDEDYLELGESGQRGCESSFSDYFNTGNVPV